MDRRTWILGTVLVVAIAWVTTAAQPAQPGTIRDTVVAVVNTTLVFEELQMVKDLEQLFRQERSRVQSEAEAKTERIKTQQKELDSGAFAKNSADYKQRKYELAKAKWEAEFWLQEQEKILRSNHTAFFEDVYKRMKTACEELAQAQGVDIVVSDNPVDFDVPDSAALVEQIRQKNVLYVGKRVDLTRLVRERVDYKYQTDGGADQLKLAK